MDYHCRRYRFTVITETPDGERLRSAFDIDESVAIQHDFSPQDFCSDPQMAMILGKKYMPEEVRVREKRRLVASLIAGNITTAIVRHLESMDTQNGYSKSCAASPHE